MALILPGSDGLKDRPLHISTLIPGGDVDPGTSFESPVLASGGGLKFIHIADTCDDGVAEPVIGKWSLR